ncbi:MAG: FG-GAP-like repeat-containing protein, partial [bacterium]
MSKSSMGLAFVIALILGIYRQTMAVDRISLSSVTASFWGENVDDESGYSVSNSGDVNGDGYDDILIGAAKSDEGAGQVYLIFGKSKGWTMKMDLSQADASFVGEAKGDEAGWVCIPGDVNGDGYDDILVGAPKNDDGGVDAGQSYLIFGQPSGWQMRTSLSNADASFIGENVGDQSGWPVAGAGDVNRDGYDDFLISAPLHDAGGEDTGQTYLIFGNPSGWSWRGSLSRADASFVGQNPGDESRCSQFKGGDVNGDGYDDLLLCAWRSGGGRGQTYLLFGRQSGWAMRFPLFRADASFLGQNEGDTSGYAASGAGDVNGDGYADILIGAPMSDRGGKDAGQVYLIFGKPNGWVMNMNLAFADVSFVGEGIGDGLGSAVFGADYNQDGYADILIGAKFGDKGGEDAGQTYLILGKSADWEMTVDLTQADAILFGESPGDWAGHAVSGSGDNNGDGYPDILIGAPGSDGGGANSGQTYLVLKATPRLCLDADSLGFGPSVKTLTLTIKNCGIENLSWTITCNEPWCTVLPSSGLTTFGTDQITVSVDRSKLDLGSYSGSVSVTSNGGNQDVSVTVEVTDNPQLCVDPVTLDFGASRTTGTFNITNCGTGTLTWSITADRSWITLDPPSGSTTTEADQIVVAVDRTQLGPGDYTGAVNITSNGGDKGVSVSLTKEPPPK